MGEEDAVRCYTAGTCRLHVRPHTPPRRLRIERDEPYPLSHGDTLSLGDTTMAVELIPIPSTAGGSGAGGME
jgi:hypothetical protein